MESIDVFIEIPKGDDRRRHLSYDKKKLLDLGPTKDVIPVNEGIMPIAYGFVIGTLQKGESSKRPKEIPDEVDILVYSNNKFSPGEKTKAIPIAFITREDGDHKVVAVDSTTSNDIKKWEDIPSMEREIILKYFGYKFPIKTIEDAQTAIKYIDKNRIKTK